MLADPRRIAVAFCAMGAFLHLYAPQSVLPMMAQEYGIGAAQASFIITACTLAVAATAPFTGALSDVLGRKRVIVVAMDGASAQARDLKVADLIERGFAALPADSPTFSPSPVSPVSPLAPSPVAAAPSPVSSAPLPPSSPKAAGDPPVIKFTLPKK